MHLNLQKTIYMLSKYFLYGFIVQMMVFNFVMATNVNGQYKSIDKVQVRIDRESITLNQFFKSIEIDGYQRYPLSNHLYWLRYGRPGGHEKWHHLNDQKLSDAYSSFLKKNNLTDTLIATCIK